MSLISYLLKISLFAFFAFIINEQGNAQNKDKKFNESIQKWKKAIVNLESRKNKWEDLDSQRAMSFKAGLMPLKRITGTSVFLKIDKKRYLITARHVLFDADAVLQKIKYGQYDPVNDPYSIYLDVMQVQSSEEPEEKAKIPGLGLGLMSVPSYKESNYVFSTPELDLAIISLDGNERFSMFADVLEMKGYQPISLSDIDTTSLNYGDEIMCTGYPSVSFSGLNDIDSSKITWFSNYKFFPVITFGRVANPDIKPKHFLADLTIAPGNSGGPIIKNNKLVGIVSSQGQLSLQNAEGVNYPDALYRVPYGFIIRSANIFPLLRELIEKDKANEELKQK